MKLSLDLVKADIVKHRDFQPLTPLLLFWGRTSPARIHTLWNFILAAKRAKASTIAEIINLGRPSDLTHLCGLHKAVLHCSLHGFLSRLILCPSVTERVNGLREYVDSINFHRFQLTPIPLICRRTETHWRVIEKRPRKHQQLYVFKDQEVKAPDLLTSVHNAVPITIPEEIRNDLCQDLLVGILSGELLLSDIPKRLGEYTQHVFAQYPMKYGPLSLDAPVREGDERTLGEMLEDKQYAEQWEERFGVAL